MVFGHLEVLHAKFHDRTISNLGDYVEQTDKQTNRQTDKQTDNVIYYVDYWSNGIWAFALLPDDMTKKVCVFLSCLLLALRVFSILGFVGRYSDRRSFRAGHCKRWWPTVSSGQGQSGQELFAMTPILLRWEFSGTCCDLRRKIVVCSDLFNELTLLCSDVPY